MADGREYAWAKVYCDLPRDPKLTVRPPLDRWLYAVLILLARENSAEPGTVPPDEARPSWLAAYTGHTLKGVTQALCYFEDRGMVATTPAGGLMLVNFEKRQAPSDSTAAERMQRFRNRHRNAHRNDAVTATQSDGVDNRGQRTDQNPRSSDSPSPTAVGGRIPANAPIPEYVLADVVETFLAKEDVEWAQTQMVPALTGDELRIASQEFLLYWQERRPNEKRTVTAWRHAWKQEVLRKAEEKARRMARVAS